MASGLSSSAAIEVVTGIALDALATPGSTAHHEPGHNTACTDNCVLRMNKPLGARRVVGIIQSSSKVTFL
jgi:hypothetical protein